ncbi:3-hydroxyacyl-CoA dehydratase 2 [Dermatophagoides pteronyssinus]|uniref:Very-long-chain (3R)-3-hydroxyacyl-CoA dehydratase n=1 Tax=Dermatophagoides pteronyssinus TaxID=6956 RepID=A0A6P6YFQ4_DERPT|nr:very-long-chain (3R)-3-hydroxyacyl-CoA dehydratase-like [Dermatophagoides pteronyssinus]
MMNITESLSPFVYWGQTSDSITLIIDLKNVKSPVIDLKDKSLYFFAVGVGAKGLNEYSISVALHSEVVPEKSFYKISDRNVEFVLRKKMMISWPRLLESSIKPQWLKVDFDRIKQQDFDTTSEDSEMEELNNQTNRLPRMYKDRNFGRGRKNRVQDFKTAYLFLYNLFQFVGYIYIFVIFFIHYIKEGPETIQTIYPSLRNPIKFLNLMQILEILHPLIGYTEGSAMMPFFQLLGRTFFIFILIDYHIEIQSHYATFYLLLVYTISELVRYPYYMLHIFKVNIRFVTWIRYSAWMVLYPLGFIFEAIILYLSIPLLEANEKFSIFLPNAMNFSFYMPTFLRLYLNFTLFPTSYFLMSHMYRRRTKMLSIFKRKIN